MTNAERQAALRERRRAQGLVTVTVYIHETRRAEFMLMAAGMKEQK